MSSFYQWRSVGRLLRTVLLELALEFSRLATCRLPRISFNCAVKLFLQICRSISRFVIFTSPPSFVAVFSRFIGCLNWFPHSADECHPEVIIDWCYVAKWPVLIHHLVKSVWRRMFSEGGWRECLVNTTSRCYLVSSRFHYLRNGVFAQFQATSSHRWDRTTQ